MDEHTFHHNINQAHKDAQHHTEEANARFHQKQNFKYKAKGSKAIGVAVILTVVAIGTVAGLSFLNKAK
jgi:hypothetical protein